MEILVHKVASMEDTPEIVTKFDFNSVKMNVLGDQTYSCSWYSVNLTIVAILRFQFFIMAIDSFVKCLHNFIHYLLADLTILFVKP